MKHSFRAIDAGEQSIRFKEKKTTTTTDSFQREKNFCVEKYVDCCDSF
jgi:hypothetical protein